MSLISPSGITFQSVYRIVAPTINVKTGTLNANAKFNTQIPFDYAAFIYEVEWGIALKDVSQSNYVFQITTELTEATNLTSASNTDTLLIDDQFYEERAAFTTSGQFVWGRNPFLQFKRNFLQQYGAPYPSVAQTWNIIASLINISGSGLPTNGADIFANIWYTLNPVTPALRDYLTKRQQIQR